MRKVNVMVECRRLTPDTIRGDAVEEKIVFSSFNTEAIDEIENEMKGKTVEPPYAVSAGCILDAADEQERQGFIQTAEVLRGLVND